MKKFWILFLVIFSLSIFSPMTTFANNKKILLEINGKMYTKNDIHELERYLKENINNISAENPSFKVRKTFISAPTVEYIKRLESLKKLCICHQDTKKMFADKMNSMKKYIAVNSSQSIKEVVRKNNELEQNNMYLINQAKKSNLQKIFSSQRLNIILLVIMGFMLLIIIYLYQDRGETENRYTKYRDEHIPLEMGIYENRILYLKNEILKFENQIDEKRTENAKLQIQIIKDEQEINSLKQKIEELESKNIQSQKTEFIKPQNGKFIPIPIEIDHNISN